MKEIKLLLTDDQDLIRESLHIVLDMDPDIQVVGLAENGRMAVELCAEHQPDVVLMDIHMPEMDGVEATRRIKAQWPHIRVIILTTFQEIAYVVDALSAGAEGYLLKAIHPRDLAAGIKWVNRGGTLIPQDIAKMLVNRLQGGRQESSAPAASGGPAEEAAVRGGGGSAYGLSDRELQVLHCISDGLNNREIAEKLFLSEGTVKNYISSIYSKMDVRDRIQATKKAQDEGML
ncbi:response regulator [Gorillibacterium sp. sgz5001074]|uniref:response regulator n=1 Tax=Gorillibacterium sp. sgz5001074 TaxID=3446695 RepID=UPI003F670981